MATKKIDPELISQLERVAATSEPVEAVMVLKPEKRSQVAAMPEDAERITEELIERVKKSTKTKDVEYNVFRYLGTFVVAASAPFVRELLKQPEIASAMANRRSEGVEIPRPAPGPPTKSRGRSAGPSSARKSAKSRAVSSKSRSKK